MKHRYLVALALAFLLGAWSMQATAQFRNTGLGGGIGFGQNYGQTDLRDRVGRFMARAFIRYGMTDHLAGELGAGLGKLAGAEPYIVTLVPIDYRFVLSPFSFEGWNPYLYAGFGALHFQVNDFPPQATSASKEEAWTGFAPGGLGLQFVIHENILLEASGGFNYTLSKEIKGLESENNDAYFNWLLGVSVTGEDPNGDPDNDGLTNREEKQLGTDKKNPDSDGDGLRDGAEVKTHMTNPLNADSDADGLTDGAEVTSHRTDPNKADTDGDTLNDKSEITTSQTDPVKADTDGDGLQDGAEINTHKTDPLRADSDSDGLNDGDEIQRHRTNPLAADTDGGTVDDATEVGRGTDPLNPADDVAKKVQLEVGKAIVLEGIEFATGKSTITPASEETLQKALQTLQENPEISVEVRGHTDNTGRRASNLKLSQARADAVKAWLVKQGVVADRITTKGYGPDNPIDDNGTPEGRQKNRRIEFYRTK